MDADALADEWTIVPTIAFLRAHRNRPTNGNLAAFPAIPRPSRPRGEIW